MYEADRRHRDTIWIHIKVQTEAYEDEKGWLRIKVGTVANLRQIAEQLWAIDSKTTVYYNPNNPKKCYVDRQISGSFTSIMFVLVSMVIIILSILVFFS